MCTTVPGASNTRVAATAARSSQGAWIAAVRQVGREHVESPRRAAFGDDAVGGGAEVAVVALRLSYRLVPQRLQLRVRRRDEPH